MRAMGILPDSHPLSLGCSACRREQRRRTQRSLRPIAHPDSSAARKVRERHLGANADLIGMHRRGYIDVLRGGAHSVRTPVAAMLACRRTVQPARRGATAEGERWVRRSSRAMRAAQRQRVGIRQYSLARIAGREPALRCAPRCRSVAWRADGAAPDEDQRALGAREAIRGLIRSHPDRASVGTVRARLPHRLDGAPGGRLGAGDRCTGRGRGSA